MIVYYIFCLVLEMGVERQAAKINWITSLAMIVTAGTLFRMTGLFSKFKNISVKEMKEKAGLMYGAQVQRGIVPRPVSSKPGDW